MNFDEGADAAEYRKQAEHRTGIGDRQKKCLWNVPGEVSQTRFRSILGGSHAQVRRGREEPQAEYDERQPTNELNDGAMGLDRAGDGANAKTCAKRDQAVAHHRPDTGGNSAPKAALDRALD